MISFLILVKNKQILETFPCICFFTAFSLGLIEETELQFMFGLRIRGKWSSFGDVAHHFGNHISVDVVQSFLYLEQRRVLSREKIVQKEMFLSTLKSSWNESFMLSWNGMKVFSSKYKLRNFSHRHLRKDRKSDRLLLEQFHLDQHGTLHAIIMNQHAESFTSIPKTSIQHYPFYHQFLFHNIKQSIMIVKHIPLTPQKELKAIVDVLRRYAGIQFTRFENTALVQVKRLIQKKRIAELLLSKQEKEKYKKCVDLLDGFHRQTDAEYETALAQIQKLTKTLQNSRQKGNKMGLTDQQTLESSRKKEEQQRQNNEQKQLIQQEMQIIHDERRRLEEERERIQEQRKQLHEFHTQFKKAQEEFKALQEKYNRLLANQKQTIPTSASENIFLGEILEEESDYGNFILSIFKNVIGKTIRSAKVLFRYDPYNKTNFHQYFDDKPNILLIVKTKQGMLLGAFTRDPFSKTVRPSQTGIIFSLTNRKVFKSSQKAIVYDDQIMIFGNSELRITTNAKTVYSNIGVNSGYYDWRGTADILLGEGSKREVDLQTYQILQLTFAD